MLIQLLTESAKLKILAKVLEVKYGGNRNVTRDEWKLWRRSAEFIVRPSETENKLTMEISCLRGGMRTKRMRNSGNRVERLRYLYNKSQTEQRKIRIANLF